MKKSLSSCEIKSCAKTVSLTLILQVVARANEALQLSSAPLPVSICNLYTMPWLLVFDVETVKETMKEFLDQVLINSPPSYTRNSHHVMKPNFEAFDTKPEIKALPIVLVKVKGQGEDVILTTYALLDSA